MFLARQTAANRPCPTLSMKLRLQNETSDVMSCLSASGRSVSVDGDLYYARTRIHVQCIHVFTCIIYVR